MDGRLPESSVPSTTNGYRLAFTPWARQYICRICVSARRESWKDERTHESGVSWLVYRWIEPTQLLVLLLPLHPSKCVFFFCPSNPPHVHFNGCSRIKSLTLTHTHPFFIRFLPRCYFCSPFSPSIIMCAASFLSFSVWYISRLFSVVFRFFFSLSLVSRRLPFRFFCVF